MTTDRLLGQQLANFRLDRLLGQGNMGQVYYGWDVKLKRPVAVKVIEARLRGNAAAAQRFVREAQAVAPWRHENIAQVYYADEQDGLYYFVMEYLDGMDLSRLLSAYAAQGELMPQADVLSIGRAVAGALDYAHKKGVIHRDVKPSNVMVTRDDRVVLSDFGLAMDMQQGSQGEVFGTAHYIAPEQARRSSDAVPQSDLYSLGVMLYEMLTGAVPFDDPSPTAVALQHITQLPPSPRRLNPDLNIETESVLLKALGKNPAERYQTGEALLTALESALRAEKSPAKVSAASMETLPPLPAGALPPAGMPLPPAGTPPSASISQPLRPSRLTVAERVSSQPAPQPVSPSSQPPAPKLAPTGKRQLPVVWILLGGGIFGCIVVAFAAGMLWKSQSGSLGASRLPPTVTTRVTATEPPGPTSALTAPPAAGGPPTEQLPATLAYPLPSATPPQGTVGYPPLSVTPPQGTAAPAATDAFPSPTSPAPAATSVPSESLPTTLPQPTVKYPSGKRFVVYYDENSLYLLNASQSIVDIPYVIFERLLADGTTANRFTGSQWYKYGPTSRPTWCMALKIQGSPAYLNPPECGHNQVYLSVLFPARTDPTVFWTPRAGSQQFRVLWKGSGTEEEVARCEIAAGACEVFFP